MKQQFMGCNQYSESNEMETAKIQFMDLCDDAIEKILGYLNPKELASCADTRKKLQEIAQSIYSRKYRNHLV